MSMSVKIYLISFKEYYGHKQINAKIFILDSLNICTFLTDLFAAVL